MPLLRSPTPGPSLHRFVRSKREGWNKRRRKRGKETIVRKEGRERERELEILSERYKTRVCGEWKDTNEFSDRNIITYIWKQCFDYDSRDCWKPVCVEKRKFPEAEQLFLGSRCIRGCLLFLDPFRDATFSFSFCSLNTVCLHACAPTSFFSAFIVVLTLFHRDPCTLGIECENERRCDEWYVCTCEWWNVCVYACMGEREKERTKWVSKCWGCVQARQTARHCAPIYVYLYIGTIFNRYRCFFHTISSPFFY